jgi:hypothetical protein
MLDRNEVLRASLALLIVLTVDIPSARAQVDYEFGLSALQFNFSNPGARSLALAGALTGAGDDATGAWTNPGALTNISRPEVGIEIRGFDFSTLFVSGGRFNGVPRGVGLDTVSGLTVGDARANTYSPSFVSAVIPGSRIAFAFYRTEVANFESAIQTEGAFFNDSGLSLRLFPKDGLSISGSSTMAGPRRCA